MTERLNILLVDDNEDFLEVLGMDIEDLGFGVVTAPGVDEAFQVLAENQIDIIVSDLHMDGKSGMDFIFELRQRHNLTPFIFLTGAATKAVAVEALRNGAFDLLEKPIDPEELARVLRSAGQLVRKLQVEPSTVNATQEETQLVKLRSSAAAFDEMVKDSGVSESQEKRDEAEKAKPSAPLLDGDFEAAAATVAVKSQIDHVLKKNLTAISQLENGQFSKTALSFLCRSYSLVRESADQISDGALSAASETASNCFSFFRVSPRGISPEAVQTLMRYNTFLIDLNKYGQKAMKKHAAAIAETQALERELEENAA